MTLNFVWTKCLHVYFCKRDKVQTQKFKPKVPLPKLKIPIDEMFEDTARMKAYATSIAQCWKGRRVQYGDGCFPIWSYKIPVAKLSVKDQRALKRAGHKDDSICMADIVQWSDLVGIANFARGPPKAKFITQISWLLCLRLFILVWII